LSFWRSVRFQRAMVSLLAVAAVVIAFSQAFALWTLDSEFPTPSTVAYSYLLLAGCGGALALFFAWRLPDRPDGRVAGLLLSLYALSLSLSLVPSQAPSSAQHAAFAISMVYFVVALRFTMLFPRQISQTDLQGLGPPADQRAKLLRPDHAILRLQELIVSRPSLLWALAAILVGLWYVRTSGWASAHNLQSASMARTALAPWVARLLAVPLSLAVAVLSLAFLRSGYRLSNAAERQKILWIVLAVLLVVSLLAGVISLYYLTVLTDFEIFRTVLRSTIEFVVPVSALVILTGFAVAVMYSGAFDVAPVITKTTIYGGLLLILTFLFAAVEELVESLLAARTGMPEGLGTWLGAAAIAVAIGPLRTRLERVVARVAPEVTDAGPGKAD